MPPSKIKYIGFYSRYPFNKESRKSKEILFEGSIQDLPDEYQDLRTDKTPDYHKFCIVYKWLEE